ncbi:heme-NO-binding protein [Ulvibacter sp. MAR_2010_11]|uniref:heme NO-binding domain-containing protein n=1 Tax=Ulvibacter sp. MAR_2010_11 TaxID=1250229 RepID=UPI000C2BCC44|nr:heme NO-binding domain-containing protein [Ulvibacter sp. MAR_2010_11]PKA82614.1 heme-NO-binding protein [Ulvibacter sp. MAR_2010_11]
MKGIVFTEFLELVESKFGLEVVDEIITNSNLPSKGVYTAVGTYSFSEMLSLLNHLSRHTSISVDELLMIYSEHFFSVLVSSYPELIKTYKDPLEMLASIENHIHVEVLKIYPDAELPTFEILTRTENSLVMLYKSSRSMYYFGLGLMHKTFEHFNSSATITFDKIKEDGSEVKFTIVRN